MSPRTTIIATMAITALTASARNGLEILYPLAPSDNTVDTYFGTTVPDPYRPLENDTAAATEQWVRAENALTDAYLMQIPFRERIRQRLTELNDYAKIGLPSLENDGRYYIYENNGLQHQSVLYRMDRLDGDKEVFIDPNTFSADGTVALGSVVMSPSGKYTAYTVSRNGSDWQEIYIMDTATRRLLDDHIMWVKVSNLSWLGDEGLYYSSYPVPEEGKELSNVNAGHRVYFHRLGTAQSTDRVEYEDPEHPLYFLLAEVSENGEALFLYEAGQGTGSSVRVKDLRRPGQPWQVIEASQDYDNNLIDVIDGTIYLFTTIDAPLGRVVAIPLDKASKRRAWRNVVAQQSDVMAGVQLASDRLVVTYDHDAANRVYVYDLRGRQIDEIKLPALGIVGISASPKSDEMFYAFATFNYPSTQYTYNVHTGHSEKYRSTQIRGFNPEDYVVEQVFYTSADGTRVPMFITYKKGLKRDGHNPVLLYGYGGFNITLNPSFSTSRAFWLENGGIYCVANLRGGNEYGEEWHLAGTKMNKMNVFNDFIAAAEYMIAEGWTSPEYLTINGGSNGGLLVGACVNLRPDLFGVAIPQVGVMDMMRYHRFTIGWNWASDYGTSADSPEMAQYLLSYSPLHTIRDDGTPYPAILVTTADHDDRVVPAHSFKYAATLQAANTGSAPKIVRIISNAGHGAGMSVSKVIDEYTDIYSFIYYNLPGYGGLK